jgi:hypothetical protein
MNGQHTTGRRQDSLRRDQPATAGTALPGGPVHVINEVHDDVS